MKKILIIAVIIFYCFSNETKSQDSLAVPIGTKIPDFVINKIANYGSTNISISSLKDKAILFDFGTTSCIPCVKALPLLDSIQNVLNDKIQIFMVTFEKREIIEAFLKKNPNLKVPIIYEDTLLHKYFKHKYFPHEVWIDKNKIVNAYTDGSFINMENVDSLVRGFKNNWPIKWDITYNSNNPLIALNKKNIHPESLPVRILSQSSLTTKLKGVEYSTYTENIDSTNNTIRISMINFSIIELYMKNQRRIWNFNFPPSQVILDKGLKNIFFYDAKFGNKKIWNEDNLFCYETVMPMSVTNEEKQKRIVDDLDKYFNIKVTFERKKIPCWILIVKDYSLVKKALLKKINGNSISSFIYDLNRVYPNPPVINETNLNLNSQNVFQLDIEKKIYSNISELRKSLAKNGLDIEVEDRIVDLCLISKSSPNYLTIY